MDDDRRLRLVRRALPWDVEPEDALRLVRFDSHPVALLGAWAGGSDIIASEPTQMRTPPHSLGDVMEAPSHQVPGVAGGSPFGGGWIGYMGLGLAEQLLPAPAAPGGPRHLPTWWFGYYDHVLRRDQATGRWTFEALWTPDRADALDRRFDDLSRRYETADREPRDFSCGEFTLTPSADEHRAAVRRAIDYIGQGDIFQANICLRLEAAFSGDPLDAFCRTASALQPPYAAFLHLPEGSVASLSPELFLHRTGTTVVTRPIKGTRQRPADEQDSAHQRDLLLRSEKDRAENVMIVDLMRNDLSRVCAPGSVVVPRLLSAEAHPGVWHLVSDVHGTISGDTSDGDLIAATFPPGSVTGAPKVRAMEIIHSLETIPREVYTGAIGYRSPFAGLELNVAIRTFEFHDGRVWLGSGGGITARSNPDEEYRECLLKATPLIAAMGARFDVGRSTSAAARTDQVRASISIRPRPAAGVFTSLRVASGGLHDLDGHLARLEESARRLYGKQLPASLRSEITASLRQYPSGRLRITAQPVGGPLKVSVEVVPVDPPPATVTLRPVTVPGGLGDHKWLDRRLLAHLTKDSGPGEQVLVQDDTGEILETDRANVFAVIGGVLRTSPADGRILPGVTRAAVLRFAGAAGIATGLAPLTLPQLTGASEVFVTNSVQGIVPVHSVGAGTTIWSAGPVAARISTLLADRSATPASTAALTTPTSRIAKGTTGRSRSIRNKPVVVLIDNYDSFSYNVAHLLLANHCRVEVVRNDEVSAQDVVAFGPAGIVISPGPCTPAEAGISVDCVRICGPDTPILGICLGHQAIAAAYGGRVVGAPRPVHGVASAITHDGCGVLHDLPQRFPAARYHSLIVDNLALPDCLSITARTSSGIPMGLRHNQHPIEGVQFHPESILTAHGETIARNFTQAIRYRSPEPATTAEPVSVL